MSESDALTLQPGISFRSFFPRGSGPSTHTQDFALAVEDAVANLPAGAVVVEYGAGANPMLVGNPRIQNGELNYYRVDISEAELDKGESFGTAVVGDVSSEHFELPVQADLAISRMLAEHLPSGRQFLLNVRTFLKPGGRYIQVSPVLYAIPFLVNKLLPERFADIVLSKVTPNRDRNKHGKFPATYSWCRPPSNRHLARLRSLGLDVVSVRGYFGHGYYERIPGVASLHRTKSEWLAKHPVLSDCSFALVVMTPAEQPGDVT